MKYLISLLSFVFFTSSAFSKVPFLSVGTTYTASLSPKDRFDESASEIPAYCSITGRVFVSNDATTSLDVLELDSNESTGAPTLTYKFSIDLSSIGGGVNAVAVKNGLVAVAVQNSNKQANGKVAIFSSYVESGGTALATPTVGALPDHLTFTNDGSKIVVANEGEPNDGYDNDPHGSISIINLSGSAGTGISTNVTTLDFTSYNDKKQMLTGKGVRIFGKDGNATVAEDLEPEYVAITEDDSKAFVTLQENNAFAVVDLNALKITDILPLGYKDWGRLGLAFDASNKDDGYNPFPWRVLGMYQPDSVVSYNVKGKNYFITANEGDARDYDGYSEETRVKDLDLDYNNTAYFPTISLTDMAKLEGLKKAHISNVDPSASFLADIRELKQIGEVTALYAEASAADGNQSFLINGQSGDTQFPYLSNMKAIATVGEFDPNTGYTLTGYPDGQAAWLEDNETIRVAYQSESYATMGKETYPWEMSNGVSFTGSHIHTIDYDRAAFADFLSNNLPASSMFKSSGKLFHTVYNVFGNKVLPKDKGGVWGNQVDENGSLIEFSDDYKLSQADFFFQSFCGAWYEKANKYGSNIGFANDVWLTAEEWAIGSMFPNGSTDADSTMGLASVVVDIANETAYTVPALGQTGYEKLLPINPGHTDYVVLVLAGYNHNQEPAPNRIYVGLKGKAADGLDLSPTASSRDKFLAANGLLYGKIYGLAVATADYADLGITVIDASKKMMDDYMKDADADDNFSGKFFPTTFRWDGFDSPEAVKDTEMMLWEKASEQPSGYTFFNGDTKTEHPAVDPDITKHRFVQNMTDEGGLLGFDLGDLDAQLTAANGTLPTSLDVNVTRLVAAVNGAMTLDVGGKGVGNGTTETAAKHIEENATKMVAPDGLLWVKTADADILIVDEDSGNDYGERKYALILDSTTFEVNSTGYFLAQAGGEKNERSAYELSAYGSTFDRATSSEFSGSWNVSALVARKSNGTFYSPSELSGTQEDALNQSFDHHDSKFIGVLQHRTEGGGPVTNFRNDTGGQILMFGLDLPVGGNVPTGSAQHKPLTYLVEDSSAYTNPGEDIQDDDNLGRLKTTTANGDADGDGKFETIYAYGARSFSIWDEDGKLVFDSGNDIEKIVRDYSPDYYHSSNDVLDGVNRSDDKGTEPEGLTLGKIGDQVYAFIGLERVGGILVYDVTTPDSPEFVDYVNNRDLSKELLVEEITPSDDDFDDYNGSADYIVLKEDDEDGWNFLNVTDFAAAGDLGPEGMVFVDAQESPTGQYLLIVSNEVSGTTTVYTIGASIALLPIENLTIQPAANSIHLNWVDNNKNSSGSKVYRSTNGGSPALVATLDSGVMDWKDESVDAGSNYSYYVEVFNSDHSAKSVMSESSSPSKSVIEVISSFKQSSDVKDPEGYAEISTFDPSTNLIFVSNGEKKRVDVFNFGRDGIISFSHSISLPSSFGGINSVAVSNGILAVAAEADVKQDKGSALLYSTDAKAGDAPFATIEVGSLPDHLMFTPDGLMLLVANEGEPNNAYTTDPEGSISIIDVKDAGLLKSDSTADVTLTATTLDFTKFNSKKDELKAEGVRIFGNDGKATVAEDLEPEYIAVSADSKQAFVTLQENNAFAIVDLEAKEITDVVALGFKDWAALGLAMDATDKDKAYNPFLWPVLGMYQPDAIASFSIGDKSYYITANEGDAREYFVDANNNEDFDDGEAGYVEEVRVKDLDLDFEEQASKFIVKSVDYPAPNEGLTNNLNLGRLKTTTANGDTDGDGKHEIIYSFGGRSFSIWDETGKQVYDSGNMIEHIVRNHLPDYGSSYTEGRSDDKGPEPEGVTIGVVDGKTYAFVGLERSDAILVFDVTDPESPVFLQFATNPGDVSPEGLAFISSEDSPTGKPVVIVTNEVSGSITAWEMSNLPVGSVQGLSIYQDAGTSVLSWDDSSSVENGYIIYRKEGSNSSYEEIGRVGRNVTNFFDMQIQPGNAYSYKVHAFNDVSESNDSEAKDITASLLLTILHANDAEQLLPTSSDAGSYGGAALFISKIKELRSEYSSKGHGVISISAGDNLMPGRELSASLTGGKLYHSMFLDQAGFEFASIGNHEFDAGPDVTANFIKSANHPTFLSSNLDFSAHKPLDDLFKAEKIVKSTLADVKVAGSVIKVGIVGATTKNLNFISSPSPVVVSSEVAAKVQEEVNLLNQNGAKLIILVSHLQGVSEELSLLTELSGVDVVIAGGGDNRLANPSDILIPGENAEGTYPLVGVDQDGSSVPVVTVDGQLKYIGRLTLNITTEGKLIGWNGGPNRVVDFGIDPFHGSSPDLIAYETIEKPISNYVSGLSAQKISSGINFALEGGKDDIRARETNLGNLIADSQLWIAQKYAAAKKAPVADVALANGGGIRASINDSSDTGYKVSVDDTYTVLPFGNIVSVVPNVSSAEFKLLLENAYSKTILEDGKPKRDGDGTGRFAQIAGFKVEYDITAKPMIMDEKSLVTQQGVRVVNATMNNGTKIIENGIPVDNLLLNVAIVDFLADNKGDQYFSFRSGLVENVKLGFTYQSALAEYISDSLKGDLSSYSQADGRIKFDAKSSSAGVKASSVSGYFPGAKKVEGSWKDLTWFGTFWDQEFPWIYHTEHGWLYAGGTGGASMWFYDLQTGWWWTNEQYYPYVYLDSIKDWVFYQSHKESNSRFFYLFSDGGKWVTYPLSGQ